MSDMLFHEPDIRSRLMPALQDIPMSIVPVTGSTNDDAKAAAAAGAPEGSLFVAASQSKGRGRLGRTFYSPEKTGIYMTMVLRPQLPSQYVPLITPAAAVAVATAIEELTGQKAGIKWVNDIWMDNHKVCGILTEATLTQWSDAAYPFDSVILGIGMNLAVPQGGFPEEIRGVAQGIFDTAKAIPQNFANDLIASVWNHFWDIYHNLTERTFLEEYRHHLFFLGKQITVQTQTSSRTATALDIDQDCHLQVIYENGETATLSTDEISIRL